MNIDAPNDNVKDSILTPLGGIFAGITSSAVMLVFLAAIKPVTGIGIKSVLGTIADSFLPAVIASTAGNVQLGLAVHLVIGATLGILYAVCQQRIAVSGLIGVGIFYGLFIWIISSLFGFLFSNQAIRETVHSWHWFMASLLYGFSLALITAYKYSKGIDEDIPVPLD